MRYIMPDFMQFGFPSHKYRAALRIEFLCSPLVLPVRLGSGGFRLYPYKAGIQLLPGQRIRLLF